MLVGRPRPEDAALALLDQQVVDVERKFRETRLYSVAPVANNIVLAYLGQHVLGMPRSY